MRDCPDGDVRDLLPLYVSGGIDDATQSRVEAHLKGCADCTAEVEVLRATVRAFQVKPVDAAAIGAKLPSYRSARRARPFHSQPLWRVAAAMTFMIAGTATLMVVRQSGTGPIGMDTLVVAQGSSPTVVPETTAAPGDSPSPRSTATISFGNNLADLTDAQLEALLASLDRMDGTVSADPQALITPLVPETPERKNQ